MRHHDKLTYSQIEEARESIARAIENGVYRAYCMGQGALPLDIVPVGIQRSEEFEEMLAHFGWPDEADAAVEYVEPYQDNATFVDDLLRRSSDSSAAPHLNNFISWLSQAPSYEPMHTGEPLENIYARAPSLHRVHAVMPDLVEPMQLMIADMRRRNGTRTADFHDELALGVNDDLVTAARMAYTAFGRLFRKSDKRLQSALAFPGSDVSRISDVSSAFEELTT